MGWDREVGDEAEMVAGPYAIDRFVKDPFAGDDLKGRSTMFTAAHEDVVDPAKRPVPIGHEGVGRRESVPWFARMHALPGIAVADAHLAQRLTARPEANTSCVGIGIEVPGQHHMLVTQPYTLLHKLCG